MHGLDLELTGMLGAVETVPMEKSTPEMRADRGQKT